MFIEWNGKIYGGGTGGGGSSADGLAVETVVDSTLNALTTQIIELTQTYEDKANFFINLHITRELGAVDIYTFKVFHQDGDTQGLAGMDLILTLNDVQSQNALIINPVSVIQNDKIAISLTNLLNFNLNLKFFIM